MNDLIQSLRGLSRGEHDDLSIGDEAADEIERLQSALAEIREEWAGAECGEPVYAQEAYAIHLARRMYEIAADALGHNASLSGGRRPSA